MAAQASGGLDTAVGGEPQLKLNAEWVCCRPATRSPATSVALKLCQVWRARSSMRARRRCWCRIGRSVRKPRRGLQLPRSIVSKPIQKMGRSEALRQAMLGYLNDKSSPRNAYPAFWGPFARIAKARPVELSIVHSSKISERDAVSRGPANGACYALQQTFLQHIWPVCRINQNSRDRLGKPGVHHY